MASEDAPQFAHIRGNAPDNIKRALASPAAHFDTYLVQEFEHPLFGSTIMDRLVCTEISLYQKPDEPKRVEAKVVVEVEVKEDMLNCGGNVHGGCSAFLVDMCSSLSLTALSMNATGEDAPCVSSAMNLVYHSPAGLGDKLRIVSTTLTLGGRVLSARTEIWSSAHHRLVASGTHIKMQPTPLPKHSL